MAPEALLRLEGVSKRYPGGVTALEPVELDIAAGEFLSLLGPSGCGKTTTLRLIAGFEQPSGGRVLLGSRDITGLRPFDRPVNTVFQDYALFPHMNVADNVGFGLSLRPMPRTAQRRRVEEVLALVGLADKIEARVQQLSGGQRQRVALARAIVCEPRILLLDEPLSALDAHLREQMQVELKRLQTQLGMTFVLVTHDQTEALSISDRIVVMNKGRIEQVATPATLYDWPATRFVAGFIGTMNLLEGRFVARSGDTMRFDAGGLPLDVPAADGAPAAGTALTLCVRPEDLAAETEPGPRTAPVRVTSVVFHGRTFRLHGALASGAPIVVDVPRQSAGFSAGEVAHVRLRDGAICSPLTA